MKTSTQFVVCALTAAATAAQASEIGHYAAGVPNIHYFTVPAQGRNVILRLYGPLELFFDKT